MKEKQLEYYPNKKTLFITYNNDKGQPHGMNISMSSDENGAFVKFYSPKDTSIIFTKDAVNELELIIKHLKGI